ncbi:cytochrome c oxidase subunit II [Pontibacillus salicampi]|uniref:Cytochrome c oxidase subunit 2 n=1 Tax=Pontibacillus salicampi TaxID=1449801 RepID=A0ABV6LS73_9BACI
MKRLSAVLALFVTLLSGCNMRVFDPISETARDQSFLIVFSFILMMIVLIVVFILFIRFVLKYRMTEHNQDYIPPEEEGNKTLEIIWTVLPVLLLIVLAVPTIRITYDVSSDANAIPPEAVAIDVTAQRYSWTFEYPNGVQTIDSVVLPKDRPVVFNLHSKDVIHSFWIPNLGGKKDAIPGEDRSLRVTPDQTGTYQGKCAEFCGVEHAQMRFTTEVKTQAEFQQWLEEKKQTLE